MGSDRARVSYDEKQQYRSVVMQQGRVTLEADANEALRIVDEEIRHDALDFVGPAGTPDDGYRITPDGAGTDFQVQAGTMYVGGVRAYLPKGNPPITYKYTSQPDWLFPAPPDPAPPSTELVFLHLLEQEISAVEVPDLKDVALGGPDTAQRSRLLQHVHRLATQSKDCSGAWKEAIARWNAQGLDFHSNSMRVIPQATLKVSFSQDNTSPNLCKPVAQGGYLGADNQLIRVEICEVDQAGNAKFLWGFDNASFLYPVTAVDSQNLQLSSRPVDQYHQPRNKQAVQVLRSTAKLANGAYVAYAADIDNPPANKFSVVTTLAGAYSPDSQQVTLNDALSNDFLNLTDPTDPTQKIQLYLRVWEEHLDLVANTATSLGQTGVQVTFKAGASGKYHVGDYWTFAVRPSTSTQVYPERYLDDFQPADGPRQWVCPLAVVDWKATPISLVDCRNQFDNLVDLTKRALMAGCCTVQVRPEDLKGNASLQSVVDQYRGKGPVRICLMPGKYSLAETLRLGSEHSSFTIEACNGGVVLQAAEGAEPRLLHGLLLVDRASDVTVRGLRFEMPWVPFAKAGGKLAAIDPKVLQQVSGPVIGKLQVSIGLRALECSGLTIDSCAFHFTDTKDANAIAIGVLASGACSGLKISRSTFRHDGQSIQTAKQPFQVSFGLVGAPIAAGKLNISGDNRVFEGVLVPSLLQDCILQNNDFERLTAAAVLYAEYGDVSIQHNTARDCYAGIEIFSLRSLPFPPDLNLPLTTWMNDSVVLLGATLARAYPWPSGFKPASPIDFKVSWPAVKPPNIGSVLTPFFVLHDLLAAGERQAFEKPINNVNLNLDCSHNTIVAIATKDSASAIKLLSTVALFVFDDRSDLAGSAIVHANNFSNDTGKGSIPTMALIQIARATVTGNLTLNQNAQNGKRSIVVVPLPSGTENATVAVTGNVFHGTPQLPVRPLPAPLHTWDVLNAVVP
jgi:hypothetical protein